MESCIDNKKINKKIKSTIAQWSKAHKARLDDIENNFAYYYEGGVTEDYTSVDFDFEMLDNDKAQLQKFLDEMKYAIDRLEHTLDTVK